MLHVFHTKYKPGPSAAIPRPGRWAYWVADGFRPRPQRSDDVCLRSGPPPVRRPPLRGGSRAGHLGAAPGAGLDPDHLPVARRLLGRGRGAPVRHLLAPAVDDGGHRRLQHPFPDAP